MATFMIAHLLQALCCCCCCSCSCCCRCCSRWRCCCCCSLVFGYFSEWWTLLIFLQSFVVFPQSKVIRDIVASQAARLSACLSLDTVWQFLISWPLIGHITIIPYRLACDWSSYYNVLLALLLLVSSVLSSLLKIRHSNLLPSSTEGCHVCLSAVCSITQEVMNWSYYSSHWG